MMSSWLESFVSSFKYLVEGLDWETVINVSVQDGVLQAKSGPLIHITLATLALTIFIYYRWRRRSDRSRHRSYDIVEASIPFGIGAVKVKPNKSTVTVAYRAWVELATRKAALPFDEEHDVIVEVYDSWYKLFGILRGLIQEISADRIKNDPETVQLVEIIVKVLNVGLRPHLTRWQADFRCWYNHELKLQDKAREDSKIELLSPQIIQKNYPRYEELVADLKSVTVGLGEYTEWLARIAQLRTGVLGDTPSSVSR